jgi:hypothetical protein
MAANGDPLFDRLTKWFTYAILFALLPFGISWGLRLLHGVTSIDWMYRSPEVLFFCVMLCATALGDINEVSSKAPPTRKLKVARIFLLLFGFVSATLYGALALDTLEGPGHAVFQRNLFWSSVVFATVLAGIATVA